MATPLAALNYREFDSNGDPLSGGKLYTYIAGTSTPLATYSDSDGLVPNTNPVILDANGEANVYLGNSSYKLILKDANDVTQKTVDDYAPGSGEGVDVESESPWAEHAITDNQSATDLDGETVDFADYSSADYDVEVLRGTTVIANFKMAIQNLNGTGRVCVGMSLAEEAHGVTFTLSQVGTVAQLKAATSSGPGAGTIKLSRKLVPA